MSLLAHPRIADWITVENGRLIVHTGKVEIGQRISTALGQIAHEELTIPMDQIDIAPVRTGLAPDEGMTSGSNSIEQSGHAIRCAAATLRVQVVKLLVAKHGGLKRDWQIDKGTLSLLGTNHRVALTDLAKEIRADALVDPNPPTLERIRLEMPKPAARGLPQMVRGQYIFVHDLDVPGMFHARVIRPPHANARLIDIQQGAVEKVQAKGMHLIRDGGFLAIAGSQEWPVVKATLMLAKSCTWDRSDGLPEVDVFSRLTTQNAQRRFLVVDGSPTEDPIPDTMESAEISARYERPYQMHAALAPSAALAKWTEESLEIHSHSQGIYPLRNSIADSLGLVQENVDITHIPGSGCYGHNGADDAAFEAALIAMQMPGTPILLKWTREDEHTWEPYAPAMAIDLAANLSGDLISEYSAEVFSDTHRGRPRPGEKRAGPAKLLANRFRADPINPNPAMPNLGNHAGMHRNLDPIYTFRNKRLVKNLCADILHRTSAMRCLGAAANVFALECFMDELAQSAKTDPITFRKPHLTDPRDLAVLDELEQQLATTPKHGGRGIAYARYKNRMTRVGIGLDIDVNDQAEVALRHAVIVAESGRVIDKEGLTAQLEGGFIQAASWALYEQVRWSREGITSRDWESYPVIRFDNIPDIKVTILDQPNEKSLGAGEATPGPTLAAIGNAIFDAIGIRMRRMPFTPDAIQRCAYKE